MNANGTIDSEWHLPFSRAAHNVISLFLSLVFFSFVFIHLLLFISLLIRTITSPYHLVTRILHTIQGTGTNMIDQAAVKRLTQQHVGKEPDQE